ncbi:hypothetical protein M8J75_003610 [Diaphorina citri]|nr:hypothetical protein M8J75_003610 [Diaphorina citri]
MNIHNHDKHISQDAAIDIESVHRDPLPLDQHGLDKSDVIYAGQLSQHAYASTPCVTQHLLEANSDKHTRKLDLSQRCDKLHLSQNEHSLLEANGEKLYLSQQHSTQRAKKSPTVSLLTRIARRKLKRKKFFACELDRNFAHCAAAERDSASAGYGADYNYEYIACDRCGGYKSAGCSKTVNWLKEREDDVNRFANYSSDVNLFGEHVWLDCQLDRSDQVANFMWAFFVADPRQIDCLL